MSRKPGAPVPSQEAGEAVSGPSTGRARVFLSTDVVCPYCAAQPGQGCVQRDGSKAVISHNVRAIRAETATKRWAAWHGDKARNAELPPL